MDRDYQILLKYIEQELNIDGNQYKLRPFRRRINLRMKYTNNDTYKDYLLFLKNNPKEIEKLKDTLTINVTRFFRNRTTFSLLKKIISKMITRDKKEYIKLLSAGCSSGEEAYSFAIIFEELKQYLNFNYNIVAIDIDENMIQSAINAVYHSISLKELNEYEINNYFDSSDDHYILKPRYRRHVNFKVINILEREKLYLLGKFDIIVCRNFLIYMSREFQRDILEDFHNMLNDDGLLVLGRIEIITGDSRNKFFTLYKKERIYKKIGN